MDQRDLDGSPLEPGDLTGDDPSISETPRAGVGEANTSPEINVDPHEEKEGDESSKISRSALRRTPPLRSLVLPRCAQSPSFAALRPWLRHAAGSASARRLPRLSSKKTREPVWSRSFLDVTRDARTDGRNDGVLRDHPPRMCSWLGKPDCSCSRSRQSQRPAN